MENERKINWLSLFIKVVIIFIFILIIVWLIAKIVNSSKLSETFTNNINNMEATAASYFKTIDLPLEKGKSIKITLEEMIEKELIISVNSESENSCDPQESYSRIIRKKDKYVIETTLKCGKEKDTIKTNFSLDDCQNCNQSTSNNNENKDENTNDDDTTHVSGVTYYEYVKETSEYTKWMRGSLTGDNIENRYEYYGVDYQTYYILGVIPADKTTITYTLKLENVPNKKYYFTTISEVSNFIKGEEDLYLNEQNASLYEDSEKNIPTKDIDKYSLRESNFTYKISPYYREGNFYIRVTIALNNNDGVSSYYDSKLQKNAYLIPLKINVKFASNEISETKPSGDYETISYYRYVTVNKEILWSTESHVEGYSKTGNTKVQ